MNCAESQDLLLDLAYGELPPARAAEVEAHVVGCAACRAEKAQLDDARNAAAPLREMEEPSDGFDEPILRAAHAEAGLQADGTPGPVVEVSASVKPLGVQAGRVDPHTRVRGGTAQPHPRWGRRAGIFASVAAAAGLAVVVSSSLLPQHRARQVHDEVAPIQVRAPGTAVPQAVDEAIGNRARPTASQEASGPQKLGGVPARPAQPAPPAPPAAARKMAKAQEPAIAAPKPAKAARRDEQGAVAAKEKAATKPIAGFKDRSDPTGAPPAGVSRRLVATARSDAMVAEESRPQSPQAAPPQPANLRPEPRPPPAGATQAPMRAKSEAPGSAASPPERAVEAPLVSAPLLEEAPANPDGLEDQAGAARRRGDYARAAALYREASALRKQAEPARAAWDMAHAVECLAAGGRVDEAVAARKELLRSFPDQSGPRAAADSALRSVRLPPDE